MTDTSKSSAVEALSAAQDPTPPNDDLSLESLILLINTERLQNLKDQTAKELKELKERQEKVRRLHELLSAINAATDEKGKFDCSKNKELKKLLAEAKELGVDIKEGKFSYTKEERDRLVENVRMAVEDYNVENEMQIQAISRLTNERYESYQMARSILKPLHEDKQRKAREIAGR